MKKIAALILALCALAVFAGCSGASGSEEDRARSGFASVAGTWTQTYSSLSKADLSNADVLLFDTGGSWTWYDAAGTMLMEGTYEVNGNTVLMNSEGGFTQTAETEGDVLTIVNDSVTLKFERE